MIINLKGDVNISYVQNLCLIFFPGAKFGEEADDADGLQKVDLTVQALEGGCYAKAVITVDDKSETSEHFAELVPPFTIEKTKQIAVGTVMYNCGCKLFDYSPPWGILTGIRPAKMALQLYTALGTKTAAKKALCNDYLVSPKKAQLAMNIALFENKLLSKFQSDTCSLYISIPFCPTRCAYCSFISYATNRLISMIPEYLARVCKDLEKMAHLIKEKGQRVVTVYIGGGTPTMLEPSQLEMLLSEINKLFDMSQIIEFTLEGGRPDTITAEKLSVAEKYGVTRLCVNPQTLNDDILCGIGRKHTAADFLSAFRIARESGIPYINTDIIAGLPGDNFASFAQTVDSIIALRPEDITVHTFFAKKASDIVHSGINVYSRSSAEAVKCVDYSQVMLSQAGYSPYYVYRQKNTVGNLENVGFCLDGANGYYNSLIMSDKHNIYAVGAGGSTKIISKKDGKIKRFYTPKYPYEYLSDKYSEKIDSMYEEILAFE